MNRIVSLIVFLFYLGSAYSQSLNASKHSDSVHVQKKVIDTAKKAFFTPGHTALASAIIPGSGQIINGQWWKTPILYGGLGTLIYFIIYNQQQYISFRNAYLQRLNPSQYYPGSYYNKTTKKYYDPYDTANPHPIALIYDSSTLITYRDQWKHYRDEVIIITGVVYVANIVDAYVFAHLKEFDISDKLSMRIVPVNIANIASRNYISTGIVLNIK
jgi:hypothetical protein